jgi:hypothetical protein
MRRFTDQDLLDVWEEGLVQRPLDRVLTLLTRAQPELPAADIASLPLGKLNDRLLELHRLTFGNQLDGTASCPHCGDRHEFHIEVSALQASQSGNPGTCPVVIESGGTRVEARLPTLEDLVAIARCQATEDARRELITRCVRVAIQEGSPLQADALPSGLVDQVARQLADADPGAEILLRLECRACGEPWTSPLDPGEFIWSELSGEAHRLLHDVHTLARAYGWSESDILRLGPGRRQAYLDLVEPG